MLMLLLLHTEQGDARLRIGCSRAVQNGKNEKSCLCYSCLHESDSTLSFGENANRVAIVHLLVHWECQSDSDPIASVPVVVRIHICIQTGCFGGVLSDLFEWIDRNALTRCSVRVVLREDTRGWQTRCIQTKRAWILVIWMSLVSVQR